MSDKPEVNLTLVGGRRYTREEIGAILDSINEALPVPAPQYSRVQALAMIEAINAAIRDGAKLDL